MHRSTAKDLKDDPYFADIDWYLLASGHYKRTSRLSCSACQTLNLNYAFIAANYRPTFPSFNKEKASIRFSSFHSGLDVNDGKSVHLSPEGLVTPNSNVLRQLRDDRLSAPAQFRFRFPLKRVHSVLHERSSVYEAEYSDDEF